MKEMSDKFLGAICPCGAGSMLGAGHKLAGHPGSALLLKKGYDEGDWARMYKCTSCRMEVSEKELEEKIK